MATGKSARARERAASGTSSTRTARCSAAWRPWRRGCCKASTSPRGRPILDQRRPRRHRERGEGEADGSEGRTENLPVAQRLRRRAARRARQDRAPEESGAAGRRSGARHAAEDEARRGDVSQAQGVRAGRSSAHGSAAAEARGRITWRRKSITARAGARRRRRACSSDPARARSPSIDKPLEASFPAESLRLIIRQPLVVTETAERFDVLATTAGGGVVRPGRARCASASRARSSTTTPSCARGCARRG